MARIRALGIEPVQVNLSDPNWKEAFLHPRSAHGIVIQVAQQASSPAGGAAARASRARASRRLFDLIEHRVGDLDDATPAVPGGPGRPGLEARRRSEHRRADLAGRQADQAGVREDGLPLGGSLHHIRFTGADGAFSTHAQGARGPAGQAPRPDRWELASP